ncbi:MAG: HEPN domain-containing protein [Caldilineae bacterium]|nr:MAG: HEPN domain-containing protein [Caldilineae bacterium]
MTSSFARSSARGWCSTSVDDYREWTRYAEQDWQLAVSLLRRKHPPTVAICFHAQQSAEKYLKAMLLSQGVVFPRTHDLATLASLCEQHGILTGFLPRSLTLLSEYAVAARYPGNEPTPDEAREAIEIARSVRAFVRKWLGLGRGSRRI